MESHRTSPTLMSRPPSKIFPDKSRYWTTRSIRPLLGPSTIKIICSYATRYSRRREDTSWVPALWWKRKCYYWSRWWQERKFFWRPMSQGSSTIRLLLMGRKLNFPSCWHLRTYRLFKKSGICLFGIRRCFSSRIYLLKDPSGSEFCSCYRMFSPCRSWINGVLFLILTLRNIMFLLSRAKGSPRPKGSSSRKKTTISSAIKAGKKNSMFLSSTILKFLRQKTVA